MSDEPESGDRERFNAVLKAVKDLAGEHCRAFVFIGEVECADGEGAVTVATWDGTFNSAIGLAERMKERLRQRMIETDFPSDPPGEDWKQAET